jgi:hypothetical protein
MRLLATQSRQNICRRGRLAAQQSVSTEHPLIAHDRDGLGGQRGHIIGVHYADDWPEQQIQFAGREAKRAHVNPTR